MFEKLVEQKIREAQRAGEFERLEGAGRPIDLEAYFATPEELRAAYAVLKNAGVVPEEVELLKEIEALRARRAASTDAAERERLGRELAELNLKYRLHVERAQGRQ